MGEGAQYWWRKTDTSRWKKKKEGDSDVADASVDRRQPRRRFLSIVRCSKPIERVCDREEFTADLTIVADDAGVAMNVEESINDRSTTAIRENWNCDLCARHKESIQLYIASWFYAIFISAVPTLFFFLFLFSRKPGRWNYLSFSDLSLFRVFFFFFFA